MTRALLILITAGLGLLLAEADAASSPRLQMEPTRLVFPPPQQGSSTQSVLLTNVGDAPLAIHAAHLSADAVGFRIVEGSLPARLAPGQSVSVAVRLEDRGPRRQAFGAVNFYTDDPRGYDDPRTEERDYALGIPLLSGESRLRYLLLLPPLFALLLPLRPFRRALLTAAALIPLGAALYLAARFQPDFGVRAGNYGYQFLSERSLLPTLYFRAGLDGLSAPLLVLLCACCALVVLRARAGSTTRATLLMLLGGAGLLVELDVRWLALSFMTLLLGVWRFLRGPADAPPALRSLRLRQAQRFLRASFASSGLLVLALSLVIARSLPATLADGTMVPRTFDLVKLTYANDFGAPELKLLGLPLAQLLWTALCVSALLPLLSLIYPARGAAGAADDERRLLASVPTLILAIYVVIRLAGGLCPEYHTKHVELLRIVGAAVLCERALRVRLDGSPATAIAQVLWARLGAVILALGALTQSGTHGLICLCIQHALVVAALTGLAADRQDARQLAGVWPALLLSLELPLSLGLLGRGLLVFGMLPSALILTGIAVLALLVMWVRLLALLRSFIYRPAGVARVASQGPTRLVAWLACGLGFGLGLWPQLLLRITHEWVGDFLSHTAGFLGAAAFG